MAAHILRTKQFLPIPIDEAWDFFCDPKNLSRITPAYLNFKILTQNLPQEIYEDLLIEYTVSPLGFPMKWVTEIGPTKKGNYFSDRQKQGPYKHWRHQHLFYQVDGGVQIEDIVEYALPFGLIGEIAHLLWVRRQLHAIFAYRADVLNTLFGSKKEMTYAHY